MNRTAFRKAFFCCSALVLFFAGSRELAAQQAAKPDTSGTRVVRTPENLPPDAVRFQSTDSLIYRANEGRKARLFGSAKVQHTAGELRAGSIRLDLNKNTVQASSSSPADTLSYPILKRQADEIKSTEILFNYKTEKGKFVDALIPLPQGDLIVLR